LKNSHICVAVAAYCSLYFAFFQASSLSDSISGRGIDGREQKKDKHGQNIFILSNQKWETDVHIALPILNLDKDYIRT
jgi:hypothetical protein